MLLLATTLMLGHATTAVPSANAHAQTPGVSRTHTQRERHHTSNLVGFKAGSLSIWRPEADGGGQYVPAWLFGVSYERTLVEHWLELEVTVPVAVTVAPGAEQEILLPIDIHLKKPFELSPTVTAYLAAGPAFDVTIRPKLGSVYFGASFAAGLYWWFAPTVGVDLQGGYNVVAENGRAMQELIVQAGPVFRF